eukprot:37520-Rhodomonas_salina.1
MRGVTAGVAERKRGRCGGRMEGKEGLLLPKQLSQQGRGAREGARGREKGGCMSGGRRWSRDWGISAGAGTQGSICRRTRAATPRSSLAT